MAMEGQRYLCPSPTPPTYPDHTPRLQILKSLLFAEHLQAADKKIFFQSRRCVITEEVMCTVCRKRIGTSAFARQPDGTIRHYFCSKDVNS